MKRISQDTVNAMVQTWTTSGETISQQTKQVGKGITEGVTKPTKEAKTAVDRLLERINKIEQAQGKIKRITDFLRPDQVEIQPIPIPGAESIGRVDAFAESSGRTRWPGFTLPGETTSEPWPGW
ncbi:MAG: hypothetical protein GWN58_03000 [Anaerolineae bacterium]|nr:hypothetical protein [Anaerolineae bacterium]